jgi:hypothetical protein
MFFNEFVSAMDEPLQTSTASSIDGVAATTSSPVTPQQLEPPEDQHQWIDEIEEVLGPI